MVYFNNLVRDVKKELSRYLLDNILVDVHRNIAKFIYDMVWGILSSGSSKISMISRHLYESDIRVTENRLTKNLMELNLEKVKENYFQFVIKDLAKLSPHILVDETDVIKPYGVAFEGLSFIHDASKEGKPREKGWPVTGIVTLTESNYVIPLATNIYSSLSEEHKSIADETMKHLNKIIPNIRESYKCTIALDRGYDSQIYASYIANMGHYYVIRAKEKRKYITNKGRLTISELAKRYKGKYAFTYYSKDGIKRFAKAIGVKVAHKDFNHGIYLVIETIHNENDVRVYLTNIDCSSKEDVTRALKGYRLRWRIEEYFRFVKTEYGLERFMIRSLDGINNLFLSMNIATTFLTYIIQTNKRLWEQIQEVYQPLTNLEKEEKALKYYGYRGISLYRAKEGMKMILGHAKGRPPIPGRNRKKKIEQLSLF